LTESALKNQIEQEERYQALVGQFQEIEQQLRAAE
jgi:hypothetical protein